MFHQNILKESTETEDRLGVGGHLVESEPEPQVESLEGGVELGRLVTDVAHGGGEHGETMEGNDSTGWVDHHVVHGCILPSQHGLGGVGRAAGEGLGHLTGVMCCVREREGLGVVTSVSRLNASITW